MPAFHDIPYVQPSSACTCEVQPCGGLVVNSDCPDHGYHRNPAMMRHMAGNVRCQQLQAEAQR